MKHRKRTFIAYLTFLILLVSLFSGGCLQQSSGLSGDNMTEKKAGMDSNESDNVSNNMRNNENNYVISNLSNDENYSTGHLRSEAVDLLDSRAGNSNLSRNYKLAALDVELKVPAYELPLNKGNITNYGNFSGRINLSESALKMLENNGFVVIENPYSSREEDITSMYKTLKQEDIPIFITTDSLLHLYHIQFDETLRQIEEREFYDTLWNMDLALLNASIEKYNSAAGEEKEAARRNVAYFAVALSLLQPKQEQVQSAQTQSTEEFYGSFDDSLFPAGAEKQYQFEIPEFVKEDVKAELALIEAHNGFALSPIFKYQEDYSQYVPRGHYTRSEKLKNYFKAFMWHGQDEHAPEG